MPIYENTTDYLKNHWTKHRHVCSHVDALSMLIPNMGTISKNLEFFENFLKIFKVSSALKGHVHHLLYRECKYQMDGRSHLSSFFSIEIRTPFVKSCNTVSALMRDVLWKDTCPYNAKKVFRPVIQVFNLNFK